MALRGDTEQPRRSQKQRDEEAVQHDQPEDAGRFVVAGRQRSASTRRRIATAGVTGAIGGMLVPLLGGRLMGGSLDLLARTFPGSRLRLDQVGALVGDHDFDVLTQLATGGVEGALFAACIVGALLRARDRLHIVG